MTPRFAAILAAAAAVAGAGCGSSGAHRSPSMTTAPATIELSSAFAAGGVIPTAFTCDGRDVSPPLQARGVPAGTVELLVVMRDRDVPGGNFIHWAIAHVSPRVVVSAGAGSASLAVGRVPPGAVLGRNSFGSLGYRGPCPPRGAAPHHYEITMAALGRPSGLGAGFPPPVTAAALASFASRAAGAPSAPGGLDVVAVGRLTGVYARR